MPSEKELLCEQVITQNGGFRRVRRWWKGWHPGPGRKLCFGWQGEETLEETTVIKPTQVIEVKLPENK